MLLAIMLAAAVGTSLEPTSKWYVDYATDSCTVGRSFGTSTKPVVLGIIAGITGHGLMIELVDSRVSGELENDAPLRVQIARDSQPLAFVGQTAAVGPGAVQKVTFPIGDNMARILSGATWMSIGTKRGTPVALNLPGLGAALIALEKCRVDLVSSWGMSAEEQSRLNIPAHLMTTSAQRAMFISDDYPTEAIRDHKEGSTSARIKVEPDGRISDCTVTRSSGSPALDSATCRVVRLRWKYTPALDAAGAPVASFDTTKVNWIIPH